MKQLIVLITLFTSLNAFAGEKINITVKGMVCSFCSQGITKKFTEQGAAKSVNVNLDNHLVSLELKDDQKLTDETITKVLTDAGYAIEKITRQ
jgi:periplasmic mercuric ion binding protein